MKRRISIVLTLALMLSLVGQSVPVDAAKKVKLKTSSATIKVGQSTTIKLKNKPAKAIVKYASSSTKIAKVTSKGKVTGKSVGNTTIKITVKKSKKVISKLNFKVKVVAPVKATATPSVVPTTAPTEAPTISPTPSPTASPTASPTVSPSVSPSVAPSATPSVTPTVSPAEEPTVAPAAITEDEVYQKMIAMKSQYPDGTPWTNDNTYLWKAYKEYSIQAAGCAAFAAIISDAAFGEGSSPYPARKLTADTSKIRVGDILRINGNTHSVIVLSKDSSGVTVAEGNINSQILWGRKISFSELQLNYIETRYPE